MIKLPQFQPRLAIAGHIKNGINVPLKDGKGNQRYDERGKPMYRPEQLDHYLVTTLQEDPQTKNFVVDQPIMDALRKASGTEKITRLPILVHSDDFGQFLRTELAARKGKTIICRGDAEKAMRWNIDRGARVGKPFEVQCPCSWYTAPDPNGPKCKANATLRCKLALPDAITIGSCYDFHTTSEIGIPNMLGGFAEIQSMIGTLVWVPLWMELRAEHVQPEGYQKTVYSSFVHLRGSDIKEIQERAIAMVRAAKDVQALAGRTSLIPLPPVPVDDDDESQTGDEFYPPEQDRFNPKTGEILDVPVVEGSPTPSTEETPMPSKTSDESSSEIPQSSVPPMVSVTAEQEADPLKTHQVLSKALAAAFKSLCILRGAEGKEPIKTMSAEILSDISNQEWGTAVKWGELTVGQGDRLLGVMRKLIEDAEKRRDEEF